MEIQYLQIARCVVDANAASTIDEITNVNPLPPHLGTRHFIGVMEGATSRAFPTTPITVVLILRLLGTALDRDAEFQLTVTLVGSDAEEVQLSTGPLTPAFDGGAIEAFSYVPIALVFPAAGEYRIQARLNTGETQHLPFHVSQRE